MFAAEIGNDVRNWNDGGRTELNPGDTLRCTRLRSGQLYGIFAYNAAQHANNADLTIVWSNSEPPKTLRIPGTTQNAGSAALAFVSGSDTTTISVSLQPGSGDKVEVWLGSVDMPINTSHIHNEQLPMDGKEHPFNKYTRYFAVPPSSWHRIKLTSDVTQFLSVQFRNAAATVFVLNETSNGLRQDQVIKLGPTANQDGAVTIDSVQSQVYEKSIQGDGTQWVWMNADSQQDSDHSTISLQSLT